MTKFLLLIMFLGFGYPLWGVEESEWHTIFSPNQRFVVQSLRPEWSQAVSVWAGKSVRLLERETGENIPFARYVPLRIVLHPDAETTRLHEMQGRGLPRQEIMSAAAESLDHLALADAFVRACLHRILTKYKSGPEHAVQAPDVLVFALSHHLLEGESRRMTRIALQLWREGRLPPPWRILAQTEVGSDPETRAAAAMALRWALSPGIEHEALWQAFADNTPPDHHWWVQRIPEVSDLRGLQIEWSLWLSQRSRAIIARDVVEDQAFHRLQQLLRFRPGEYGLDGDLPRYEVFQFWELEEFLDEKWLRPLLEQWMLTVQPIRLRQSAAFIEMVDHYLDAARQLLSAGRATGRSRDDFLEAHRQSLNRAEAFFNEYQKNLHEAPDL